MTDRELLKQALEALNRSDYLGWQLNIPIIKSLKERLAQPEQEPVGLTKQSVAINDTPQERVDKEEKQRQEQEPVAWMWKDGTVTADPDRADGTWTPLYTTPPPRREWVGLTKKEVKQVYFGTRADFMDYARAIEAKLREKNT